MIFGARPFGSLPFGGLPFSVSTSTPGTAGGGRIIRGGEAYYPGRKKLKRVEKRIEVVTSKIRNKEAEEQALVARQGIATSAVLRARLSRIEAQIVALELELAQLELMRIQAEEAREMEEVAEVYAITRMLH